MNTSSQNKFSRLKTATLISFALAIAATVLRILCFAYFYDNEIGYFKKSPLPVITNIFILLSAAFLVVCAILLFPKGKSNAKVTAPFGASKLAAVPAAVAVLYSAAVPLVQVVGGRITLTLRDKLVMVFAVFAFAFFIALAYSSKLTPVLFICGLGTLVWLWLSWLNTYLDIDVAMNSPNKLFLHVGISATILFVFEELRAYSSVISARLYFFSVNAAVLCLSVSAIPSLFGMFTDKITENNTYVLYDLAMLGILIYVCTRALTAIKPSIAGDADADGNAEEIPADKNDTETDQDTGN